VKIILFLMLLLLLLLLLLLWVRACEGGATSETRLAARCSGRPAQQQQRQAHHKYWCCRVCIAVTQRASTLVTRRGLRHGS
jgi:hypothetical protein